MEKRYEKFMDSQNGGGYGGYTSYTTAGRIDTWTPYTGGASAAASWFLIPQGTTENSRIGNRIRVKRMFWKVQIRNQAGSQNDLIRTIVWLDKQPNGSAPTISQLLIYANVMADYNIDYADRFDILLDRYEDYTAMTTYSSSSPFTGAQFYRYWEFEMDCDLEVDYSGTTGAITEIQNCNVGVMSMSVNNSQESYCSTVRVYFEDIYN